MSIADPRDPASLSTRLRKKRDVRLRDLITKVAARTGGIDIVDVGGTVEYWHRVGIEFLLDVGAKIVIINQSPGELHAAESDGEMFSLRVGDGCDLSEYPDGYFDLVHSNSVIEHVGAWENVVKFAREVQRLGKAYYVQTPYFWFPIDPHFYKMPFFHWYPRAFRAGLLRRFSLAYSGRMRDAAAAFGVVDSCRLLTAKEMRRLFPDGRLTFERFMGLPKSIIMESC